MTDQEAHDFYANPGNLTITGPAHRPRRLRPAQLAWAAAIIDMKAIQTRKHQRICDPTCDKPKPHIHRTRAHDQLTLMVETRHLDIIARLSKMTGTDPEPRTQNKLREEWTQTGCKEHCPEAHIEHHVHLPQINRWSVSGSAMATVLYNIKPYLLDKTKYQDFYDEALANATLTGRGATQTKRALKRLVNLGWKLPPELAEFNRAIMAMDEDELQLTPGEVRQLERALDKGAAS